MHRTLNIGETAGGDALAFVAAQAIAQKPLRKPAYVLAPTEN